MIVKSLEPPLGEVFGLVIFVSRYDPSECLMWTNRYCPFSIHVWVMFVVFSFGPCHVLVSLLIVFCVQQQQSVPINSAKILTYELIFLRWIIHSYQNQVTFFMMLDKLQHIS